MVLEDAVLDGLLKAVIAEPDADDLRLMYADRCEDVGLAERAEFIRLQIRFAKHRCGFSGLDTCFDRRRGVRDVSRSGCRGCRTAIPVYRAIKRLAGHVVAPHAVFTAGDGWGWRRGFVETVTLDAGSWLKSADDLVRTSPIRKVRLTTWPEIAWQAVRHRGGWQASFLGRTVTRWYGVEYQNRDRHAIPHLLAAEWPGVRFTLPES